MIKISKLIITLPVWLLLSSCAGMNSKFDCNSTGGIAGCASLSQVNRLADQGAFSDGEAINNQTQLKSASYSTLSPNPQGSWQQTPVLGSPLHAGETVQNLWIAPYETKDGAYSWPSMVSIVLQPGHWVDSPSKEIQQSSEFS